MTTCSCCDSPILHEARTCANCGLAVHADGCMEMDGWRRDEAGDVFCAGCGWPGPPSHGQLGRKEDA